MVAIVRLQTDYRMGVLKDRVLGVLTVHLPEEGLEIDDAVKLLRKWGLECSIDDLAVVADLLVAEGVLEIVGQ